MDGLLGSIKAYLAEKLQLHITSNNRSKKQVVKNIAKGNEVTQNNVTINIGSVTDENKKQLINLLKENFDEGNIIYVDDESKRLVDSVQAAESDTDNGEIVAFFKDKLTQSDWQILRTGLYIKYLVMIGMPTRDLRMGVIAQYGERGKNLLNLASSGHFTTHIKPLYEGLSKSGDFDSRVFYDEFERILREMPFALFVNSKDTVDTLCDQISEKISQGKIYAVKEKKIFLHAWGTNVKTVESCIKRLGSNYRVVQSKRIEGIEIIDAVIEY